jgi:hypothetical protein
MCIRYLNLPYLICELRKIWYQLKICSITVDLSCSSTNKTDRHDIAEILLKVTLDAINQTLSGSLIHIQNTEIYYEKQYQNDFIS